MAQVTLQGTPFNTVGELPKPGNVAPDFTLAKMDLSDISLADFVGKRVLLNIFPSLDTPTCALSVRTFNAKASSIDNTIVLCISADLPFAANRFCSIEGLDRVVPASTFRHHSFGSAYGVVMANGPLKGLMARAVVVIDESGVVLHSQLVPEISDEPNYEAALTALG